VATARAYENWQAGNHQPGANAAGNHPDDADMVYAQKPEGMPSVDGVCYQFRLDSGMVYFYLYLCLCFELAYCLIQQNTNPPGFNTPVKVHLNISWRCA
jgi:hypothetical protein